MFHTRGIWNQTVEEYEWHSANAKGGNPIFNIATWSRPAQRMMAEAIRRVA